MPLIKSVDERIEALCFVSLPVSFRLGCGSLLLKGDDIARLTSLASRNLDGRRVCWRTPDDVVCKSLEVLDGSCEVKLVARAGEAS
jgi:hypothetical protein